jgi:hypothetical protein
MVVQPNHQRILDNQQFYKNFLVLIIKHLHLVNILLITKKTFFLFIYFLLVRDHASMSEQRKNSSKIIANLTTHIPDEEPMPSSPPSAHKLQKQLSVQDTIQRHFCQILKNDSLTVTDNTSITETILMRENSSSVATTLSMLEKQPTR